jgi:oligosaccharide repeat unit polymerase
MEIFSGLLWFICAIGALKLSELHYGDKLSPIGIFGGIWFFVFGLYALKLYPYNELSWYTWSMFLGGLILFYLGNLVVLIPFKNKKKKKNKKVVSPSKLKKAVLFSFCVGMLGFSILFLRIVIKYGVSAFWDAPETIHADFTVQFVGYLYLFNGITPVLAFMYIKKFKKHKMLMSTIIMVSLVTLLFSVSRTNMLRSLVMMYLALIYSGLLKAKLRNLALVGVIALTFFVSFHYYKNPYLADRLERDNTFQPQSLEMLAPTYGYISTPFTVFEVRAEALDEYEWGINTFNTFARAIRLVYPDMPVRKIGIEEVYTCNPACSNVYTYLDIYYRDFGTFGVLLFTFLQGAFVAFFYSSMRFGNKPELFLANAVFGWCLLITFFSNHFAKNSTVFFVVICYLLGRYIYVKTKPKPAVSVGRGLKT